MPRLLFTGLSPRRSRFDPRSIHARFVVDKVTMGQVSFRVGIDSTNAPRTSLSTRCSYRKDKRARHEKFSENKALSAVGELWIESTSICFSKA